MTPLNWLRGAFAGLCGILLLACADDSKSPSNPGTAGTEGGAPVEPCFRYCAAYSADCGAQNDCESFCNAAVGAAALPCLDELSGYYECARNGPFSCDVSVGLTPTSCGLAAYAECESNQRTCVPTSTVDGLCSGRHGAGFKGYLCRLADAPSTCIQTNPDNAAERQTLCCPG